MKRKLIPIVLILAAAFLVMSWLRVLYRPGLNDGSIGQLEGTVWSRERNVGHLPKKQKRIFEILIKAGGKAEEPGRLTITYPLDETVFPPEITAPLFLWRDLASTANVWLIDICLRDTVHLYAFTSSPPLPSPRLDSGCISPTGAMPEPVSGPHWTPGSEVWETMKKMSVEHKAMAVVTGFNRRNLKKPVSRGSVSFITSGDSVGAPIFYRDVPLLPSKNESGQIMPLSALGMQLISWRLRDIAQSESKVVLKSMPTCGNCHSFSNDGKWLGMDIDGPQGDKGAYAVKALGKQMVIEDRDLISWNHDFKEKPKGRKTIGFLSRISPDGRYVATTVNEEVFVVNYMTHTYLQVFYPTRGVLAYYSRETGEIKTLAGADDPDYVHCDPVWTPDGKYVVFARARARDSFTRGQKMPVRANASEETRIQYDLFRIPFNRGRGGTAVLIMGASGNGTSNNFPKVTPDGRFIVFVRCRNGQLMRPDSRLWIVPVQGGEARQMNCNMDRMNSWHSFSPNGRWMVFSSKAFSYFTQMFLTHIDPDGNDSPPVLISNATAANRAVNLPEFVNIAYEDLESIKVPAMDHYRYLRRADRLFLEKKYAEAAGELKQALLQNPDDKRFNTDVLINLGGLVSDPDEAIGYLKQAVVLSPEYAMGYFNLGLRQEQKGLISEAMDSFEKALRNDPGHIMTLFQLAKILVNPKHAKYRNIKRAVELAERANRLSHYRNLSGMELLAMAYAENRQFPKAVQAVKQALTLAREENRTADINRLERELRLYLKGRTVGSSE